jgi:hypothetical protein
VTAALNRQVWLLLLQLLHPAAMFFVVWWGSRAGASCCCSVASVLQQRRQDAIQGLDSMNSMCTVALHKAPSLHMSTATLVWSTARV